jgi:hypothetical protein
MKKVKTEQKTRELVPVEEFSSREDGGRPVMNGAASDGAQLSGLQDRGQERKEASHKHLGQQLVVRVEKSDWPQLQGHGHPRDLGEQPHYSMAKGRGEEASA